MPGTFTIIQTNNAYHFELTSANGEAILHSEVYPTRPFCMAAIQTLRDNVGRAHCFEKMTKPNGQYYFLVRQENDGVIATSVLYWSDSSRDYAIMIVKREVPEATVK